MKTKKIITLTATGALLLLAGCSNNANDTVATSNYGNITKDELYTRLKQAQGSQTLYTMLVEKAALSTIKDKTGIDESVAEFMKTREETAGGKEAFESLLKSNGFSSIEDFKTAVYNNRVTVQVIKENITITDEEIAAAYEVYTPKMTASHILVADENLANELINQLKNGGDFAALAAQHSMDTASKVKGGSLGEFDPSRMIIEFSVAAQAMQNGEISSTPVKTQYGFHIIKMENNPTKGTLEEEKEKIKKELLETKAADTTIQREVMVKILQAGNTKIVDKQLSEALSSILSPETSATSTTR